MAIPFPEIDPIAFSLGPVPVRWYALAYMVGFLAGWRYILHLVKLDGDKETDGKQLAAVDIDDFLPWAIAGVILGGRMGYILFYQFDMYLDNPLEIFRIWEGGMSFHGGAAGAIAAMIAFAWKRNLPLLRLTDFVCCAVPIGLFFGRIANFINGELFGRVTDVPWAISFPYGGELPRHPSQLYEAILEGAVLFIVLAVLARREKIRARHGFLSGVFLIGYGLARSFVEFFREPDVQIGYIAGIFTMGQILCIPMILGGIYLIHFSRKRMAAHA